MSNAWRDWGDKNIKEDAYGIKDYSTVPEDLWPTVDEVIAMDYSIDCTRWCTANPWWDKNWKEYWKKSGM